MCSSKFITITVLHLAYSYVASEEFSGTKPDQDAESFLQLIEAATLWNELKTTLLTRFSEGRFKLDHLLEVEHCWLDDMEKCIPNGRQNAERATQKRQQKQGYLDYNLRRLRPKYLQLKAQEQLMGYPNSTRSKVSFHNIQEDVMIQVSWNFLHDVEQIKTELAILRQEMRNFRVELQEHRVNCMEGKFRPWAPSRKGNQKTVRFCNYCHENGHTPKWYRKKMRDVEIRRVPSTIKPWTDALIRTM